MVRQSFSGKTFLMLEILSQIPDRDIYIFTKSPPDQYSNAKIKIKETGEETKPPREYQNAIILFDDILGLSSSKYIDQFFKRRNHNILDI